MIIRHQDVEYKSFTRNRLTMFEYRRKPLLDQLERIENDIKKLRPETDNKRLRGAAAIPAVVAYNYFLHKIGLLRAEMEIFSSEFLSMVERQFFKEQMGMKG